ncbi:hypothetical protein Moror_3913 [Moniliophthora roreri MCA 2997]|uniref:F-box domain-containing protein n=1 Tax=Moniliophthora roreri (strain MCA 2997) TaxID=1381753 RepID=V2XR55_MONRO|nr:hypothetical protein Moror_3913 [Moniliophthora roreri MCA 2997]
MSLCLQCTACKETDQSFASQITYKICGGKWGSTIVHDFKFLCLRMEKLPTEIKDIVLSFCDEDTLLNCSLVCKWLYVHARNCLFARNFILKIDGSSNVSNGMMNMLTSPHNPIHWKRIKRITLVFVHGNYSYDALESGVHTDTARRALRLLQNKVDPEYLTVIVENREAQLFRFVDFAEALRSTFPNMSRLELRLEVERSGCLLPFIVSSFPELRVLELSCRLLFEEDISPEFRLPLTLRILHLHLPTTNWEGPLTRWLTSQSSGTNLEYLSLLECDNDPVIDACLRLNPRLRSVYIGLGDDGDDESQYWMPRLIDVSHLTRLEEITFCLPDSPTNTHPQLDECKFRSSTDLIQGLVPLSSQIARATEPCSDGTLCQAIIPSKLVCVIGNVLSCVDKRIIPQLAMKIWRFNFTICIDHSSDYGLSHDVSTQAIAIFVRPGISRTIGANGNTANHACRQFSTASNEKFPSSLTKLDPLLAMKTLPIELQETVLSFCDDESLAVCSRVCRSLHVLARNCIFTRNLLLKVDGTNNSDVMKHTLVSPDSSIPWERIKRVTLVFSYDDHHDLPSSGSYTDIAHGLLHLLKSKVDPEFVSIIVEHYQISLFRSSDFPEAIQTAFPNISRLELRLQCEHLEYLHPFVCSFRKLGALDLSFRDSLYPGENIDQTLSLPSTLHSLHLHLPTLHPLKHPGPFSQWLRSQFSTLNLTYLSILECSGNDAIAGACLHMNPQLRSLYIGMKDNRDRWPEFNISHLSHLQDITFYFPAPKPRADIDNHFKTATRCIYNCLNSITSNQLRTVVIIIYHRFLNRPYPKFSPRLDELLAQSSTFANVSLTIVSPSIANDSQDTEYLLSLAKKALPRFTESGKSLQVLYTYGTANSSWNPLEQNSTRRSRRKI